MRLSFTRLRSTYISNIVNEKKKKKKKDKKEDEEWSQDRQDQCDDYNNAVEYDDRLQSSIYVVRPILKTSSSLVTNSRSRRRYTYFILHGIVINHDNSPLIVLTANESQRISYTRKENTRLQEQKTQDYQKRKYETARIKSTRLQEQNHDITKKIKHEITRKMVMFYIQK